MPCYALFLGYEGTHFHGWQKQEVLVTSEQARLADAELIAAKPNSVALRTVQAVVEKAVRHAVRDEITLTGASRTDSGVHARGQVASFTTNPDGKGRGWPIERGLSPLVRAINAQLPEDVLVHAARIVPGDFNPIGDATAKQYKYVFCDSRTRPLWDRHLAGHIWHSLNAEHMHAGAQYLLGEHDFSSLCAVDHGRQTTVRTIYACDVVRTAPDRIEMRIEGSGFLYNMVRIIAGTLANVGRNKYPPEQVRTIVQACDRAAAGQTLAPEGLSLEWIEYARPDRGLTLRSDDTSCADLPIITNRLQMRVPVMDDIDVFTTLFTNPDAVRYLSDGKPRTREQVSQSLTQKIRHLRARGTTLWTVTTRDKEDATTDTEQIIGDCGIIPVAWVGPEFELAYRFLPSAWGKGLATEAARAALDHAFSSTSIDRIIGLTHSDNSPSMRVLEKIGMVATGTSDKYYNTTCNVYEITRTRWRSQRNTTSDTPHVPRDGA